MMNLAQAIASGSEAWHPLAGAHRCPHTAARQQRVKQIVDRLTWVAPFSGMVVLPSEASTTQQENTP